MPWQAGQSGNPAGRKPRAVRFARPIARAEKQIVDRLPEVVDTLLRLAAGGYERVEEEYAPAGTLTVGSGEAQALVFPDRRADELVLVRRRVSRADGDRAAAVYLVDRILGRPTARQELTGADGGPIALDDPRELLARRLDQLAGRLNPADAAGDAEPAGG